MIIQDWINSKFKEIAFKLPTLVHEEPASFSCGFNVGYKQALLDLDRILGDGAMLGENLCWCSAKAQEHGGACL